MNLPSARILQMVIFLACLGAPVWGAEPGLAWPLDLPTRFLTSGFMEYRPGRYHAGLDLKTRGETGFVVRAVATGSIVRVRATARAYGRAVYLQTPEGRTYVFAHLSRFNDTLRARIDQARSRSGRYRTELYFKPGEIPVRRGEVLGLTGQSGTAGPHLHFEVRDAGQHPLNPQLEGFALPDTFAPMISCVHAVPMSRSATVGGSADIMTTGEPQGGALPDTLPSLAVSGPVAFTARIVEYVDIRGYRLEPQIVAVELDGEEVYRAENSSFAFDQGSRSRLEWFDGFAPRERWLHRRPGVDVPGRSGTVWPLGPDGEGLSPGRHELVVRAVDHAGNAAQVLLPLQVTSAGRAQEGWRPDSLVVPPAVSAQDLAGCRLNPFFTVGLEAAGWIARPLDPLESDPVLEPVVLWSKAAKLSPAARAQARLQDLEPLAPAGIFLATDWPLESAVPVDFPASEGAAIPDPAQVFRWNGRKWSGAETLRESESGSWGFQLTSPGLYAVCRDSVPPRLVLPKDPDGVIEVGPGTLAAVPGITPPRWEVFPVAVIEQGTGIDAASIRATLDGKPLVVEPDLPRDRILVELPAATQPGSHVLTLELADLGGLTGACRIRVHCRP